MRAVMVEAPRRTCGSPTDSSRSEATILTMDRKPNYAFERNARAKAKAEKREAKRQARLAARANNGAEDAAGEMRLVIVEFDPATGIEGEAVFRDVVFWQP